MEFLTVEEVDSGKGCSSRSLRDSILAIASGKVINFSYTDYGGDLLDKVCISYFSEKLPKNIIKENTSWSGENAWVFGDIVDEFIEESNSYLLGFRGLEEAYYQAEHDAFDEFVEFVISDSLRDYVFEVDKVREWLYEEKAGYYPVLTTGVDFCESSLIKELQDADLIKEKE